jgi:Mn-containing catalase
MTSAAAICYSTLNRRAESPRSGGRFDSNAFETFEDKREAAEADPLITIAGGGGMNLFDSMRNAWTASYLKITSELDVDLRSNIAAEARAKIVYERLIDHTNDPGYIDTLQFSDDERITHMKSFQAALDSMEKQPFSIGMLKPTPGIVNEYFNGSTGDGAEGDSDMRGAWISSFGLHPIESQIVGGKGLSVGDINGKIDGEDRGKQDETQKAATSPGDEAIVKASATKNVITKCFSEEAFVILGWRRLRLPRSLSPLSLEEYG